MICHVLRPHPFLENPMQRLTSSRWFLAALVVALCSTGARADTLPKVSPEQAGLSSSGLKRLDALLQDAVDQQQIAGGVALLARKGKVGYLQAIGRQDVEAGKPMAPDTIFRIASMTKPVTSVAVMMLVDEGRLRTTDPISKYLPEFKSPRVLVPAADGAGYALVPAERAITVHHLLTHTSGITYRFLGRPHLGPLYRQAGISDGLSQTEGTIADNVKRLAALPLLHQPGTAFEYGLSIDVLGRLVEVVSGQGLDQLFHQRIFKPLRMTDTSFFLPAEKRSRLAALYAPGTDKKIVRVGEEPVTAGELIYSASYPYRGPRTYFSGGAGLVSTASDYARFLQMLLGGGELDGVRLLKPETVKQMTQSQIGMLKPLIGGTPGNPFGYGFGIVTAEGKDKDVASVGTYSWGGIFYTHFWVDPRKELVGILLTQVYPYGHLTLRNDFKKLAYEALAE
jgi:CubicO group peptidase (beta-lactamase class C family)